MNLPILSTAAQTMSSREIAELTGKRHDNVMDDCRKLRDFYAKIYSPEKSGELVKSAYYIDKTGRNLPCFDLAKDACIDLITGYSLPHRHAVNQRWQELERSARPVVALPNFTDPAAAAIAWAAEYQAKQAAMLERDEAIRTKAQIGSRREATAMATAAKATREVEKLKDQLGFSARHATIMQVESKTNRSFSYLPLRKWCKQHGVKAESVPDKRYESVKAWPASAWLEVYGVDLSQLWGVAA